MRHQTRFLSMFSLRQLIEVLAEKKILQGPSYTSLTVLYIMMIAIRGIPPADTVKWCCHLLSFFAPNPPYTLKPHPKPLPKKVQLPRLAYTRLYF